MILVTLSFVLLSSDLLLYFRFCLFKIHLTIQLGKAKGRLKLEIWNLFMHHELQLHYICLGVNLDCHFMHRVEGKEKHGKKVLPVSMVKGNVKVLCKHSQLTKLVIHLFSLIPTGGVPFKK